jgi:heme-degrading monooxygenase HmoA
MERCNRRRNMYARITLFEIDTLRTSLDDALEMFKKMIIPEARKQKGYEGMYVMRTPEGKGLIMSMWANEEAATAGLISGYYEEQVNKFVTLFRVPPGREHYEVVLAEPPGAVST